MLLKTANAAFEQCKIEKTALSPKTMLNYIGKATSNLRDIATGSLGIEGMTQAARLIPNRAQGMMRAENKLTQLGVPKDTIIDRVATLKQKVQLMRQSKDVAAKNKAYNYITNATR